MPTVVIDAGQGGGSLRENRCPGLPEILDFSALKGLPDYLRIPEYKEEQRQWRYCVWAFC